MTVRGQKIGLVLWQNTIDCPQFKLVYLKRQQWEIRIRVLAGLVESWYGIRLHPDLERQHLEST